jgi:hypothetical protein
MVKLIASMRCLYSCLSVLLCERPMVWLDLMPSSPLERADEGLEEIDEYALRAPHHFAHVAVHERGEDDRLAVAAQGFAFDALQAFQGPVHAVDDGQGHLVEFHALELGEQAVAQHLRRDAGAIGDEEHGAALRHGG